MAKFARPLSLRCETKLLLETRFDCGKNGRKANELDYILRNIPITGKFHLHIDLSAQSRGKFFQTFPLQMRMIWVYISHHAHFGANRERNLMAKAIAMKLDRTQGLYALALSFVVSLIIVDLVSLLIGGVLRPFAPEW